jgi:hypothetical protein
VARSRVGLNCWVNRPGLIGLFSIMAFNLISEAWLPLAATLRGPANCRHVTLAELKGSLVASYTRLTSSDTHHIEMWFLVDSNRSLWSKRYTIDVSSCRVEHHPPTRFEYFEKPIVMLGNGRIVMWMSVIRPVASTQDALLRVYNQKTCTFTHGARVPNCNHVIVFTSSLLYTGKRHVLDKVAKGLLRGRRHHQYRSPTLVPGANKKH